MCLSETSSLDDWLTWQEQLHVKEIDLGLQRVSKVYKQLAGEYLKQPYTITVAGTNGKGSCVALLESILMCAGYRVGVYSTPHLQHYNERIRLNGEPVEDPVLTASFQRINQSRLDTSLSYFEFGTLAALDIFNHASVDIQILEVGLGGRLDAVNIIDANAALITSIDIDHVDWLGADKSTIALEKAGVFRPQQKAVCGDASVPDSLREFALTLGTDLLLAGIDYSVDIQAKHWCLEPQNQRSTRYSLPSLAGDHQIQNAAAVITLLKHISDDITVNEQQIETGLKQTSLPGRLQKIATHPSIYLDVAHNAESATALAQFIEQTDNQGQVYAVFSILADKDMAAVISPFKKIVNHWSLAPLNIPRSQSISAIETAFTQQGIETYSTHGSISQAFDHAKKQASKDDLVIVFGSFYVVAACLDTV